MGFNVKKTFMAMDLRIFFEPLLSVEILGLQIDRQSHVSNLRLSRTYLLHVPKYLLSTPAWHVPIIIILLGSTNAKSSIHPTGSSQELSSADFDLAAISSWAGFGGDVPVSFSVEVL